MVAKKIVAALAIAFALASAGCAEMLAATSADISGDPAGTANSGTGSVTTNGMIAPGSNPGASVQ